MMQKRQEEKIQKEKEMEEEKKRMWKKIAQDTENFRKSRDDYEDLRNMLWEEERLERERKEEEEANQKQMKMKEELLRQNQEQIRLKREVLQKIEEEEKKIVQEMLEKFAADEEDERLRQEAAIQSREKYVAEAKQQREVKERMYKQEKEKQDRELNREAELENYRKTIIAEARRRLLEIHAPLLEGFLPNLDEL
jgi:hypothetical protein